MISPVPLKAERFGLRYRLQLVDGRPLYVCRLSSQYQEDGCQGYLAMTPDKRFLGTIYPDSVREVTN